MGMAKNVPQPLMSIFVQLGNFIPEWAFDSWNTDSTGALFY